MKRIFRPFALLVMLSLFVTTGQGCSSTSTVTKLEEVELNYWRVFDDEDTMRPIITAYQTAHPNVKINYRKLRFEEYQGELERALAAGRGPDLLSIHNTWLRDYQELLAPMPETVTTTKQEVQGTLRKQVVILSDKKNTTTLRAIKSDFPDTVARDVVLKYQPNPDLPATEKIYGLPLSIDSLVLYYNKDSLNSAGIASPPTDWDSFHTAVEKITKYDATGNIVQSAAALGTAENVERSADILALLMLQNGTQMENDRQQVIFNTIPAGFSRDKFPALDAVNFYTDFANPVTKAYTWNDSMPNSLQAFTTGKTAMFLGYSYHLPLIRTAAPKLNFGIAPMPQVVDPAIATPDVTIVNLANYWVETVAKTSKHQDWAWDFVMFAASKEQVGSYLTEANKPAALRSLIASQLESEDLGAFAKQTLTATSWYHGRDVAAMEKAMRELITVMLTQPEDPGAAITNAAKKVAETYK